MTSWRLIASCAVLLAALPRIPGASVPRILALASASDVGGVPSTRSATTSVNSRGESTPPTTQGAPSTTQGTPSTARASASSKALVETGPAIGWTFPVFSDNEGYRRYTLRGTEARLINDDRIDVTGFSAVVFSGDATGNVDEVLLSPQATFFPKENRASGSSFVRLILSGSSGKPNDEVEVVGRGWTYDNDTKKVSIAHDVRVTFHAQLHDILK